ncbi:MAG: SBBP repeat-containing protein [Bacteroidota bacterium]
MKKTNLLLYVLSILASYNSFAQQFAWVNKIGSNRTDISKSITTDKFGNVYSTGSFMDTVDFDPGPGASILISPPGNSSSSFIRKLDRHGNLVWVKSFGINSGGVSITTDTAGNVYTTGWFQGTLDFDPGINVYNLTNGQMFISKLDTAGNFVLAKNIVGMGSGLNVVAIKADDFGNIYTTGIFSYSVDFNPGSVTYDLTSAGNYDIFINKFNVLGDFVWAKRIGGVNFDNVNALAVDRFGSVYTAGYFQGTIDFDPGSTISNLNSAGNYDGYLNKLDSAGNFVWAKKMGGTGADEASAITTDVLGNIYTAGYFPGTVDFDPDLGIYNLTSSGNDDIFITKLTMSGVFVWAKKLGGTQGERVSSIVLDTASNVYTTGYTSGNSDFDPGAAVYTISNGGAFLSKLTKAGDFVWAKSISGLNALGYSVCVGPSGIVYSTGRFNNGATDFDPGSGTFYLPYSGLNNTDDIYVHATCNFVVIPGVNSAVCEGQSLNLSVNTLLASSYTWTGPNGFSSTSQNPVIAGITGLAAGVYTVTVNNNGCSASETLTVTVKPTPIVTPSSNSPVCQGQTLSLTVNNAGPGSYYSWSGPNNFIYASTTTNAGVSNTTSAANGYYKIKVTGLNGCVDSSILNVVINTLPIVTISSSSNAVCAGNNVTLTAIGANTISWSGGINNGVPFTPTSTETYIVTGTDINGCIGTSSKEIIFNELPLVTISASTNTKCSGICSGSATVAALSTTPINSYLWNAAANNQNTATATSLCQGIYTVIITDTNGCVAQENATIAVNTMVDPNIYLTNLAAVDQINISPSFAAFYTYNLPASITAPPSNPRNFVDPGKKARFKVECTNEKFSGQSIVSGICKVRSNNPYITITDSSSALNNIGWNDKAWSADEFEIDIDSNTPPGTNAYIDFIVQESGQEYSTTCIAIPITPLVYSQTTPFTIDDDSNPDSQGNDNDICDPNEIIEFYPWLDNISTLDAEFVRGRFENLDNLSYINIWNGVPGINTTVYDAGWWNYSFAQPQTINSNAFNTTPEYDFVFNYNYPFVTDFKLYMVMAGGFKLFSGTALSLVQWSLPYTFSGTGSTSIGSELENTDGLSVYPNPSNGNIQIQIDNSPILHVKIYNQIGALVYQSEKETKELNLTGYPKGFYLIQVQSENKTISKRIVIQ